jgi:putative ABC transport system permease protein
VSFFTLVLISNLLSLPLAYLLTQKWLETFTYRIEMPVLPYFLSLVITLLLTIITVSIQARSAVKLNPVNALKYE